MAISQMKQAFVGQTRTTWLHGNKNLFFNVLDSHRVFSALSLATWPSGGTNPPVQYPNYRVSNNASDNLGPILRCGSVVTWIEPSVSCPPALLLSPCALLGSVFETHLSPIFPCAMYPFLSVQRFCRSNILPIPILSLLANDSSAHLAFGLLLTVKSSSTSIVPPSPLFVSATLNALPSPPVSRPFSARS